MPSNGFFQLGVNVMNFEIQLPSYLPNSFKSTFSQFFDSGFAEVLYNVSLEVTQQEDFKVGRNIHIKTRYPHEFVLNQDPLQKDYKDSFYLWAKVQNNSFMVPTETAAQMICDNSSGQSKITRYKWKLIQVCTF